MLKSHDSENNALLNPSSPTSPIPIIMAVDTPGFLIGRDGERRKITGKIINFMNALQLVTVPKLTVVIRKSYGQAYMNMGGTRNSDTYAAWPTAEISFRGGEEGRVSEKRHVYWIIAFFS